MNDKSLSGTPGVTLGPNTEWIATKKYYNQLLFARKILKMRRNRIQRLLTIRKV